MMPFSLTNVLATFSTLMNKVLHHFLDKFMVLYLDEIMVSSNTHEEYEDHLK